MIPPRLALVSCLALVDCHFACDFEDLRAEVLLLHY